MTDRNAFLNDLIGDLTVVFPKLYLFDERGMVEIAYPQARLVSDEFFDALVDLVDDPQSLP